ncbi:PASTA domain-containing protein [Paenibacillus sp. SI8]|uniref:PASTA domain-containing protein n=1 Tax=unclassified Paenibacillus TaxID=185978 RepID=UPI003467A5EC
MDQRLGRRYVPKSQIFSFHNGTMHHGEDLFLNRNVIFYTTELENGQSGKDYLLRLRQSASFNHEGFLHILDTSIEEHAVLIILQLKPGKLMREGLLIRNWTFDRVISLVAELGVSLLDALEEQITGFSVDVDNLWLGENGRLSVINYWEQGETQAQGALGLCRLAIKLLTGESDLPGPFEALHTHLERAAIPTASNEQKDAFVKLVKLVGQGQSSLSTFIFGLNQLTSTYEADEVHAEQAPVSQSAHMAVSAPNEVTLKSRSFNRKAVAAITIVLAAIIVIWLLWPSSKADRHVTVTPSQSTKVAESTVPKQTPAQVTSAPKKSDTDQEELKETAVPSLVGMAQEDAEKAALAAGLHYEYHLEANEQAKGTVTRQDPAAGTKGLQGDSVTFWVSKGSE